MGLLDMLGGGGGDPSQADPNAMGPPAPYQPTLFDKLGSMFGGTQNIDPAVVAQLGLDPGKLQHQLAMQALMHLGAGIAASGAPQHGHTPTLAEALAGGLGQAQAQGGGQLQDMLKQAYQSKQLAVMTEAQKRQAAQNAANDQLTQSLQSGQLDPKFVAAMGLDESSLRALAQADPAKFTSMLTNWNSGNAAQARADAHEAAANAREDARLTETEKNADRRLQLQLSAQNRLPPDLALLSPELRTQAVMAKYGITDPNDPNAVPPLTKQDRAALGRRIPALQDQITKTQNALDMIANMRDNFSQGVYGKAGVLRGAEAAGLPEYLQPNGVIQMNKDAANLILAAQGAFSVPGNRGSVLALKTLGIGKPEPQAPDKVNLAALNDSEKALRNQLENLQAENEHYGGGGSPTTWAKISAQRTAAAPSGQSSGGHQVGDIITHGGKKYRVTGGDPNDPNVELVQ